MIWALSEYFTIQAFRKATLEPRGRKRPIAGKAKTVAEKTKRGAPQKAPCTNTTFLIAFAGNHVYFTSKSAFTATKLWTVQQIHSGRKNLFPVFDDLNQYMSTMHFNGQSTIKVDGERATATTYCRAYHLKNQGAGQASPQQLMIAGIRYFDTIVKQQGAWLFAERKLKVSWIELRPPSVG